ncbi:hypothetical protein [Algicola sagamiensis]|uniref:hypothetical protein n=1 Tax=Algicola sagamiensis TaxID=163869 RepID=UPI000377F708|nr:hypothetical protein [Algicola sagamiensis]
MPLTPVTVNAAIAVSNSGLTDTDPSPDPQIVNEQTRDVLGFFPDRVELTRQSLDPDNEKEITEDIEPPEAARESVRVSTTTGQAASAGALTKEQAIKIYEQIQSII